MKAATALFWMAFSLSAFSADIRLGTITTTSDATGFNVLGSVGTGVGAPARLLASTVIADYTRTVMTTNEEFSSYLNNSRGFLNLQPFRDHLNADNDQVRVFILGDSLSSQASAICGISRGVERLLSDRYGYAGLAAHPININNIAGTATHALPATVSGTPTLNQYGGTEWFSRWQTISSGDSVRFYFTDDANGFYCDNVGLWWIANASGGNFNLEISTGGGSYSTLRTLSAFDAGGPTLKHTNITVSAAKHILRVTGTTGTSKIIGPDYWLSSSTGVIPFYCYWGGHDLDDLSPVAMSNVVKSAVSEFAPDLVIIGTTDLSTAGEADLWDSLTNTVPGIIGDVPVLCLGVMYDGTVQNHPVQDAIFRASCERNGWAYYDAKHFGVSYQDQVDKGYMYDIQHLTGLGAWAFGQDVLNQVGLLGDPRSAAINGGVLEPTDLSQGYNYPESEQTNRFFFHVGESYISTAATINTTMNHLYSDFGSELSLFRTWGDVIAAGTTFQGYTIPVTSWQLGPGRTNIFCRIVAATTNQNTTSYQCKLYANLLDSDFSGVGSPTFVGSVTAGAAWTPGTDGSTNFVKSPWITIKPTSDAPWVGQVLFGTGSVSSESTMWFFGVEVRVDPNE